jgi:hypothetical protein
VSKTSQAFTARIKAGAFIKSRASRLLSRPIEELAAKTTRAFNRRRKDELAQLSGKIPEYITGKLQEV